MYRDHIKRQSSLRSHIHSQMGGTAYEAWFGVSNDFVIESRGKRSKQRKGGDKVWISAKFL